MIEYNSSDVAQQKIPEHKGFTRQYRIDVPANIEGTGCRHLRIADLDKLAPFQQWLYQIAPSQNHALPVLRGLQGDDIAIEAPYTEPLVGSTALSQKVRPCCPGPVRAFNREQGVSGKFAR